MEQVAWQKQKVWRIPYQNTEKDIKSKLLQEPGS